MAICANGISDMLFDAESIATSPVPPSPLWQLVTIAASTGYIFSREAMKNPGERHGNHDGTANHDVANREDGNHALQRIYSILLRPIISGQTRAADTNL